MKKDIYILGIESSCDETSVAVVKNGREVLSNVIASQIDIHRLYGGVVPEIASRNHVKNIDVVLQEALQQAGKTLEDIDAIAVTYGAGLLGALIVGVSFAKALSYATGKPLLAINHIQGHIAANYIAHPTLKPPFMCLLVSGGHTALLHVKDYHTREKIGSTTDDSVGECFDKVARECGLCYPGGPEVEKQAKMGTACITFVKKPHEKLKDFNFSYSGLKTAVINYIHNAKQRNEVISVPNICASFQKEALEQLVFKAVQACVKYNEKTLIIAGGVSANQTLRSMCEEAAKPYGIRVYYPPLKLCTDNAAMIASQGYYSFIHGKDIADITLTPSSTIPLE